jgi:hypothetical protein
MYNPINFDSGPTGPLLGQGDDDMKRRLLMAQLLEQGGAQKKPITSWSDGLAQGANSFLQAAIGKKYGGFGSMQHWLNPDTGLTQAYRF